MNPITVEQAQAQLPELLDHLQPGEEVEIIKGNRPIAKIVGKQKAREFGLGKGKLVIVKDDDEHLKDFEDYMP